jgi:hypothetical protein
MGDRDPPVELDGEATSPLQVADSPPGEVARAATRAPYTREKHYSRAEEIGVGCWRSSPCRASYLGRDPAARSAPEEEVASCRRTQRHGARATVVLGPDSGERCVCVCVCVCV